MAEGGRVAEGSRIDDVYMLCLTIWAVCDARAVGTRPVVFSCSHLPPRVTKGGRVGRACRVAKGGGEGRCRGGVEVPRCDGEWRCGVKVPERRCGVEVPRVLVLIS